MTIGFAASFETLTGHKPMLWQQRLFDEFAAGRIPSALDLPTGLGKTSVMALWLIARAQGAKLPRRLVYIVDRRAVVDQATAEAERLRDNIAKAALGIEKLPISTLRGRFVDNREWRDDPAAAAIIIGTVDMIGSRLLFSGYGVSPKMRPYHAGLLGADALVVLDEAHLVPPFEHLLRAIERDAALWPKNDQDRKLLPRFTLLPLSATQRDVEESGSGRPPFRLEEADRLTDPVAGKRLGATKRLRFEPLAPKEQDRQLAEAAWKLAKMDGGFSRVAVFCDRRERGDEGSGPSAQGVREEIEKLARGDKRAGRAAAKIHLELLVGARRVYEREGVAKRLRELGFIGEKKPLDMPAFLVATSAGEVGVDIDADHMVCDLVAWERMVQRLGRVNRRGEGDAELVVFWSEPTVKNADAPTPPEQRALTAVAAKTVGERLPQIDGAFDASPGAIRALAERARTDHALKAMLERATTPEPLRPPLNRALVDAWSMTSLEHHTGRPEVGPWLRGWVNDDRPQTTIVWRAHLPVREGIPNWPRTAVEKREVEDFFEAAPPHDSEKLETESYRLAAWLQERAKALLARKRSAAPESGDDEADQAAVAAPDESDSEIAQERPTTETLKRDDIVAFALSSAGGYTEHYTLGELAEERKSDAKKQFEAALAGKLLVVDGRLGGLKDGLLDSVCRDFAETADATDEWSTQVGFRVRPIETLDAAPDGDWGFEDAFVLRRDADGAPQKWLRVDHLKQEARREDARSIARPQELALHQDWTRREMVRIAKAVGLAGSPVGAALALAAALHDEGKRARRWQRAFKAPRDAARLGLSQPLAKTRGPIDQALLDGYRHEFGSLPCVEANGEFGNLAAEWQDLVLHLVAAHHGFARPVIATRGCEDAPSQLEERARNVALRFARLQKRWGPWGLAWLEALLRAADAQASRDNDEGRQPADPEAE
jgi:CRISPR-associated endonuclease/helicase Cas3